MKKLLIISVIAVVFVSSSMAETPQDRGVLLFPIEEKGEILLEPGLVVSCSTSDPDARGIDIWVDEKPFRKVMYDYVLPYDPDFVMARVYLHLLQHIPSQQYTPYPDDKNARNGFLLAKNILKGFPDHPLDDEILALLCKYADRLIIMREGDVYMQTVELLREYVDRQPEGKYRDQMEWKLYQLENMIYEFEGYAEDVISQATVYEKFLSEHTESKASDEIKLAIARLYRMAYECVEYAEKGEFSEDDGKRFLDKAIEMYRKLLESDNTMVRSTAVVATYNIYANKRIYINPNEW